MECDLYLTASTPRGYLRTGPPLGIGYLASAVISSGMAVRLVDPSPLRMSHEDLVRDIERSNAMAVGIYCCTMDRYEAFDLAQRVKSSRPEVKVLLGGPHVTFTAESTLRNVEGADIVVRGEGERTIVDLLSALKKGTDLSKVDGISYRSSREPVSTPDRGLIKDVDSIPWPAHDLYPDPQLYEPQGIAGKRRSWIVMTSRGCPFRCSFCYTRKFWHGTFRTRSPGGVVDEVEYLVREKGIEFVKFFDDVFTLDRKKTQAICREITNRGLDIGFLALTRVDCVDKETLEEMARAGCEQIQYGIETGSPQTMARIDKGIDLAQAERVIGETAKLGIEPYVFLMLGLAGEKDRDIADTFRFVFRNREILGNLETSINSIYPGSPDYYSLLEKGDISEDVWFQYNSDDPFLYPDTPPYPSEVPLQRLKAYRRVMHMAKQILRHGSMPDTMRLLGGFIANHVRSPSDVALLAKFLPSLARVSRVEKNRGRSDAA